MSVCYVNADNLVETQYGVVLREPSIHIIAEDDIFVRFGEYSVLQNKAEIESSYLFKSGLRVPVQIIMSLSGLQPDFACYVIRRMVEYSSTGFVRDFYERGKDRDCLEWLKNERLRIPINVFK